MSGKANAVLWIGLLIIALNLVSKWGEVKSVIFSGSSGGDSGSGNGRSPTIGIPGLPGSNKRGIPIDPFIPSIPITIPLSSGNTNTGTVQAV